MNEKVTNNPPNAPAKTHILSFFVLLDARLPYNENYIYEKSDRNLTIFSPLVHARKKILK